jgi:hypothetical protein
MFFSDAKQDRFVANLLKFKSDGTYLDIGSADSCFNNNTYYFDQLGWKGICIESNSYYSKGYEKRKNCDFYNTDAVGIDYKEILDRILSGKTLDYISLDVDELSNDVLMLLPLEIYDFKVMTIEHDYYRYGDKYQKPQRKYLIEKGYHLVCSNVCVQQPDFKKERSSFEDWWINPKYFDSELIDRLQSDWCYPSQILSKFDIKSNWYE